MNAVQSQEVRDYLFNNTWTQRKMSGCDICEGTPFIDLSVGTLNTEKQDEALRILRMEFHLYAIVAFSHYKETGVVFRISGKNSLDAIKERNLPFIINEVPIFGQKAKLGGCEI